MSTITVTIVSGTDNDLDTNISAFRTAYLAYVAEREVQDASIGDAVHAVFDQYLGAGINVPALQSMVAQRLNAQPENHAAITAKVGDFVRANSQGKKLEDGSVERPESLFVITKGAGGGVRRRADIVSK